MGLTEASSISTLFVGAMMANSRGLGLRSDITTIISFGNTIGGGSYLTFIVFSVRSTITANKSSPSLPALQYRHSTDCQSTKAEDDVRDDFRCCCRSILGEDSIIPERNMDGRSHCTRHRSHKIFGYLDIWIFGYLDIWIFGSK